MHHRPPLSDAPEPAMEQVTRVLSTATLGWRDLPRDGRVTIHYRFSTTHLHAVEVTYAGTTVPLTVIDPVRGIVEPVHRATDQLGSPDIRAIRSALDRVGIRSERK